MNRVFTCVHGVVSSCLLRLMDDIIDRCVCGQSLVKYVPSIYRDDANGVDMTGSQSASYIILSRICW